MDIKELLKLAREIELTPEQLEAHRESLKKQSEESEKQLRLSTSSEFLNRTYNL